jgi:phosphohistidine phosphatase
MNLYILRHAKAVRRGTPGCQSDSDRPLTPGGERRMRRIAEGMRAFGLAFDLILTSPYVRAARTAEILAAVFKARRKLAVLPSLAADADPRELVGEFNKNYRSRRNVVLVGHEPYLSRLIAMLTTGGLNLEMDFKKAGLCKLSVKSLRYGKCASLAWLLTPRQLEALGGG